MTRAMSFDSERFQGKTISQWVAFIMSEKRLSRYQAAVTFGGIGPRISEDLPTLIAALDDANVWVRWWAINALREMGVKALSATSKLMRNLNDDEFWIVWAAAEALRVIANADIPVSILTEPLSDPSEMIRDVAVETLRRTSRRAATRSISRSVLYANPAQRKR